MKLVMGQQESHDELYTGGAEGGYPMGGIDPPLSTETSTRSLREVRTSRSRRMEKLINRAKVLDPRRGKHRTRHDSEHSSDSSSKLGSLTPCASPLVSRPPTTSRSFSVPLARDECHNTHLDADEVNCRVLYNETLFDSITSSDITYSDIIPASTIHTEKGQEISQHESASLFVSNVVSNKLSYCHILQILG